jgi:hypothetical protein
VGFGLVVFKPVDVSKPGKAVWRNRYREFEPMLLKARFLHPAGNRD